MYTLDNFCTDAHALLKAKPLAEALPQVAVLVLVIVLFRLLVEESL